MTGIDVFSWMVLLVVVLCMIAIVVYLAMLPGIIARQRNHPWHDAVNVAGWVTFFCGFVLWPVTLIWAFVDVPSRPEAKPQQ